MFHDEESSASATDPVPSNQPVPTPQLTRCGICGRPFDFAASRHRPFCSERCQQVDLGRWLGESYGFPVEPEVPSDESE